MSDEGLQGIQPLLRRLVELGTRSRRTRPAMQDAAEYAVESIHRNFDAGGRPPWTPLSPRTRVSGGSILNRRGRLRGSFKPRVANDEGRVISTSRFWRRHHRGYPGGPGRGHSRTPARPIALLQDDEVSQIGEIFQRHWWGE